MVFVDTNVPMYAGGAEHALKRPCARIVNLIADYPDVFITDAEVLQEIVHRYLAQRRWPLGRDIFETFAEVMRGRVEAVRAADVERAALLVDSYQNLAARDLIHTAVMQRLGTTQIVSADVGFDRIQEFERLDPAALSNWERTVLA